MVLGKQPSKDGEYSELKDRIKKAVDMFNKEGRWNLIIISGGQTRAGLPAEAVLGETYLKDHLKSAAPLLLEEQSRTTVENIEFTKKLVTLSPVDFVPLQAMAVITGPYHIRRTRFLFEKLWPEMAPRCTFVGVGKSSIGENVKELILLVIAWLDPHEKFILPRLKKLLRNG